MGIYSRIKGAKESFRKLQRDKLIHQTEILKKEKVRLKTIEKERMAKAKLESDIQRSKANIRSTSKVRKFGKGLAKVINEQRSKVKAGGGGLQFGGSSNPFSGGSSSKPSPFSGGGGSNVFSGPSNTQTLKPKTKRKVVTYYE